MRDVRLAPLLSGARNELKVRGFTVRTSGGYRLGGGMPLEALIHREKWVPIGEAARYEWYLNFGAPDASWQKEVGLRPVVYTLVMGAQPEPPVNFYPIDTPEQVAAFTADFERFILGSIDSLSDPRAVVRGLLSGTLAPFTGRKRNRIGAVQDALSVARGYNLEGFDSECLAILRAEASSSEERRRFAVHVARLFDLPVDAIT